MIDFVDGWGSFTIELLNIVIVIVDLAISFVGMWGLGWSLLVEGSRGVSEVVI